MPLVDIFYDPIFFAFPYGNRSLQSLPSERFDVVDLQTIEYPGSMTIDYKDALGNLHLHLM